MQESPKNLPQKAPLLECPATSPWIAVSPNKRFLSSRLRASVCSVVKYIPPRPERGIVRQIVLSLVLLLALLPISAQDKGDTILVDLTINHGVAFRDGAWSAVDVFVNNTERDVDGYIEVRLRDYSNEVQSPIYQVPAVSPKDSRKHFRLYCKLERAQRIEVQLYNGNRGVLPMPLPSLALTPIERQDYLGLVLDDQHHDYGFLSSERVIGKNNTRFHREGLTTDQLALLDDHLPCYTNFDLIVLGNIDPERIAPEHRALLQRYVELGGTVVVSLGENATRYKGSWLEPLMGVAIGENTFTNENDLASRAFGGMGDAKREGQVTAITSASPSVQSIGAGFSAGALNPVGMGRVATFTVDAVSGMLQDDVQFLQSWNELLSESIVERPLNLPAVLEVATQNLPTIAGVRLFPISSVIAYLLLYFFIAIVGNWLFWNWMKRREMAWVCLVFFSLAFTSYAMIFGTQGRARSTELEQLEFYELTANSPSATLHGITGLLAKGSGRFEGNFIHPQSLASDVSTMSTNLNGPDPMFGSQGHSPFQFVEGDMGALKNIGVGASEMRFLQTQAPLELPGAIDAELVEENGVLKGTIRNGTGLVLQSPRLLYQGLLIPLSVGPDATTVNVDLNDVSKRSFSGIGMPPGTAMTVPARVEAREREEFSQFLSQLPQLLLSGNGAAPPPCLIAWVAAPPRGSIDLGARAQSHLGAALAVTWLDIQHVGSPDSIDVTVALVNPQFASYRGIPGQPYGYNVPAQETFPVGLPANDGDWTEKARPFTGNEAWALDFTLPAWLRASDDYVLQIDVVTSNASYDGSHDADYIDVYDGGRQSYEHRAGNANCTPNVSAKSEPALELALSERRNNAAPFANPSVATTPLARDVVLTTNTYTITDWKSWILPRRSVLELKAEPISSASFSQNMPNNFNRRGTHHHAFVAARMIRKTQTAGE